MVVPVSFTTFTSSEHLVRQSFWCVVNARSWIYLLYYHSVCNLFLIICKEIGLLFLWTTNIWICLEHKNAIIPKICNEVMFSNRAISAALMQITVEMFISIQRLLEYSLASNNFRTSLIGVGIIFGGQHFINVGHISLFTYTIVSYTCWISYINFEQQNTQQWGWIIV